MSIPALTVYYQGVNQVNADGLNTFVQCCENMAELRAFIGTSGMNVYVDGYTVAGDNGSGTFYWNATGTGPDDNGVTNVVPNGAAVGCWTRTIDNTGTGNNVLSDSPALTGVPTAPTATAGTNTTQIATTAFVLANTSAVSIQNGANGFRLTLTSGTPVTITDVTGATTIYCTPYTGSRISLYDGSVWGLLTSNEVSIALGTVTSGKPYDVFAYNNSGVLTLEILAWTDDTTRATALTYLDGVLVRSGSLTHRYLGTFYTTSTTQTEDSVAKRYLWNYYNRQPRVLRALDSTSTWTYTLAAFRQANNSSSNQVNFIIGVSENPVNVSLQAHSSNTDVGVSMWPSIGLDSTTAEGSNVTSWAYDSAVANQRSGAISVYNDYPGIGKHYLAWLEYSAATGTTTWYGNNFGKSGLKGTILA